MTHLKTPQNNITIVAVGSKNPVKVNAVRQAFKKVFPNQHFTIEGVEVKSGVPDQPMSDEESIQGATNRATRAMQKLNADYGVGLEGGLQEIDDHWLTSGWAIIIAKDGTMGIGSSIRMIIPPKMMELINQGHELGVANDMLFKTKNSKHQTGMFGLMTNDAITRQSCYHDGVISALSRFIHPEIFE